MLTQLTIKNFAIIDHLQAQFGPGLNALTGETGAGKSILVDALNLLLGSRASSEMIRTGEEEAAVEAYIDLDGKDPIPRLNDLGLEGAEGILIRRVVARSGKSRSSLNGNTVPLHLLQEMGEELINIYGQHEHQDFLDPLRHIDILDSSGGLFPLRSAYQELYSEFTRSSSELRELLARQKERSDRLDFLTFQSGEITRANVKPGEEEELAGERSRLIHAEKLFSMADFGDDALYGGEGSVVERLKSTLQRVREGARLDSSLEKMAAALEAVLFQAEDAASSLRAYREKIYFDPQRLDAIESRLDELGKLKKKYGPTLADVASYREKIDQERKDLGNLEERISELQKITGERLGRALAAAKQLSEKRKETARELSPRLERELSTLGMKKARFRTDVRPLSEGAEPQLQEKGMDQVEFLLSPNPGEDLKPLARIASGGELSRIMLALKRIFAEETLAKTLVFDEVDAGIGGGIAEIVGRKLREISRKHQVFCITHLPQIASFADAHYRVSKKEAAGKTRVEVKKLSQEERPEEIARMLGGVKITEKTLEHAREMLRNTKKMP